jgi:hypothetical protein
MALKIGTEDKKKVAIAAGLGVAVLGLVIYNVISMFSGGSPAPVTAPTVATAPAMAPAPAPANPGLRSRQRDVSTSGGHEAAKIPGSMANLDPTLHPEVMEQAESLVYSGKGRNIFSMFSVPVIEEAKAPIRPQHVVPVVTGPPPPPPIDLKFFGYESQDQKKKVFLLHGADVFIASEGDVVDHHYRVVKISPLSVQVEDIPYNNTQTLPLIQN